MGSDMPIRLPAHIEVQALLRQVQAAGGFATVLAKGEADAGTIIIVICQNGNDSKVYERMPRPDGERVWLCSQRQDPENPTHISDYLERRRRQDPDVWIIELDIADGERFIGLTPSAG